MNQFELHFHTDESSPCGKVKAAEGVKLLRDEGYTGIVVTDHFSKSVLGGPEETSWEEVCEKFLRGYRNAKATGDELGMQVFLGMEIRFPTDENDFLVYGFDEEFLEKYPWLYMKSLKELYEIAEQEGLFVVQAHPFRKCCFLDDVNYMHGIEVFNGNPRHDSRNHLAFEAAKKNGLQMTCGSDFHQPEDVSGKCVCFEKTPETIREAAKMLHRGEFVRREIAD